jgi:hypothetical protein
MKRKMAIEWADALGRALAVLIILLFFVLIYVKLRHTTVQETWEDIHDWIGKK